MIFMVLAMTAHTRGRACYQKLINNLVAQLTECDGMCAVKWPRNGLYLLLEFFQVPKCMRRILFARFFRNGTNKHFMVLALFLTMSH